MCPPYNSYKEITCVVCTKWFTIIILVMLCAVNSFTYTWIVYTSCPKKSKFSVIFLCMCT
jgi:hypothetical protein